MSVAIIGIGLWTPLGKNRESSWQSLFNHSPLDPAVTSISGALSLPEDDSTLAATLAERIALRSAREAIEDSGLLPNSERWGAVIGTSKGPLDLFSSENEIPFPSLWPSAPLSRVLNEFFIKGAALCPVAACATGLDAVLRGVQLIEQGDCDYVIAGSVDASINPYVLNSYRRLGVLARKDLSATSACRPFDEERSGFVLGSGGAMFVLAREELLDQSTPAPYGYWERGIRYNDAIGLTQLDPEANGLIRLLGDLLKQTGRKPEEIDLLNLHGTGTRANDLCEATAVSCIFGETSRQPWSTASKGAHGHALGAAGSIELAWLLLSMRDGLIPPIRNLENLDSDCKIRPVQRETIEQPVELGIKLSLGFGGHLTACLIRRGKRSSI
ncbi:beta-ketoacyl-[acyl-carrier-protein] synthase family protein [Rubinisphaera sp.]|uniref:beta-ketoacyl-[acyl-carrier-protein] synthase family protein n=1 Tax=Rubinisphaera sp. TaxID=2024857 RepID=UPI000C0FE015|nr:beta-ketoacyl-[acyl-carrier-protein] synthase family protein [Rubinisphaera sp.]MBV07959.1 hypothetical protein [Rubinisphaera sp.]|tara:strand:+ start:6263 stop:7417 length:1155 start_codon:yes stop_codon:yes gene_type:complete